MGTAPCPSAAAGHACVAHGNGGLRQGPCHTRDEPEQRAAVRRAGCCEETGRMPWSTPALGVGGGGGVQAPWFFFEEMKCSGTGQGYGWATLNTPNATGLPTFQESVT